MDFTLTADQKRLREEIVAFARAELSPGAAERDRQAAFPRELWRKCGERRLPGLLVPEEHGGCGLDPLSAVIAIEALGYGCQDGGLVFALCAHLLACVVPIWKHGTKEQKRRWLPGLSDGTLIAANAMTEPGSGSDAFALATRAVPDGEGFRITGRKIFASNGSVADLAVAYAATDPAKGYHGGITAFVVPLDGPGVQAGQVFDKMGLRSCPLAEIVFEEVRVPTDAVLGGVGGGAAVFAESMDWERICLVAAHVGVMERLVELAIAEARVGRKHGQPAPDRQAADHRIVDMKVRLEAARSLTYRSATRLGRRDIAMEASMTKLFVSEALTAVAQDVITLLGPAAAVSGHEAERALRDAVAATIYSGTSEIQRNIVARWLGL